MFKMPDGSTAIMCGPSSRVRALCEEPGCKTVHSKLCDFPKPKGGTCDRKLCDDHATAVGDDRDHCPAHAKQRPLGLIGSVQSKPAVPNTTSHERTFTFTRPVSGITDAGFWLGHGAPKWSRDRDVFISRSKILDCCTDLDEIEVGNEITLDIPYWLAKREGLTE